MKYAVIISILIFLIASILGGCSDFTYRNPFNIIKAKTISNKKTDSTNNNRHISKNEKVRLKTDMKRLWVFLNELKSMQSEMLEMRKRSHVWTLDYFPPEEHDRIENLLFRYLSLRNSLWEIVNYYKDYQIHFSQAESQVKGFLIGYASGLSLINYSSILVEAFLDEKAGKQKLNEAFPRSGIPEGTYDMLFSQVTNVDNIEAVKVAWMLFSNELKDSNSTLFSINKSDIAYRKLINNIGSFYSASEKRIQYILEKKSPILPKTSNRLRHSAITKLSRQLFKEMDDNLYAIRGLVFTNVSDIKMPLTRPLSFSAEQKTHIKSLLEPGDIILTYTSGYMSNIFLPGRFKHGIIYIGTLEDRKEMDLSYKSISMLSGIDRDVFKKNIQVEKIESGHKADVIEAVSEGVIFNSLNLLLDTHINRIAVLRPRISKKEREEALSIAFSLLGSDYDFKFDFNDGSYQCCTEVIYRALNSRGRLNFPLTKRMGALTLSADDIIEYYFKNDDSFDFVLYSEGENIIQNNKAKVFVWEEGKERVKDLMYARMVSMPEFSSDD